MKQFIRNVRAAKTIADERAVVQKESAAIRASFREESHDSNVRCVRCTLPELQYTYTTTGGTMSPSFYTSSRLVKGHTLDKLNV